MKKIKQITFDEALALTGAGVKVYAIKGVRPSLMIFARLEIREALDQKDELMFLIFEEAE